jgi:hypothetical protein
VTSRRAHITWLPPDKGGRQTPPSGPRFSPTARFAAAKEDRSVVLELVSRPAGSADWIADIRFLFDDAPQDLLADGARFELYEGKRCVAHGTILAASEQRNPSSARLPAEEANLTQ